MQKQLGRNTVVLFGVGHTNAHVLRMWKMDPPKNAQLVCVSNFPTITYSGMLPGVIAGQYPQSAMEIDLIRLAQSAGARVVIDEVVGLDPTERSLKFENRPPLKFDVMSIGIGSRPSFQGVDVEPGQTPLLAVKPMQTFLRRLSNRLHEAQQTKPQPTIAIVGGGLGSVEIAFCLHQRFYGDVKYPEPLWPQDLRPKIQIVTGGKQIGTGLLPASIQRIRHEFTKREIDIHTNSRVSAVDRNGLVLVDGNRLDADVIIWATGAVGPEALGRLGLETDERGFLVTDSNLQVKGLPGVFAVGDTGSIAGESISKAGVYAVRQGPILNENIRRLIRGKRELRAYRPQTDFLKLINMGGTKTIAEFKGFSFYNSLCWPLKDWIDVGFMKKYQDYQPMEMSIEPDDLPPMRCLGCGGKIGSSVLTEVLKELQIDQHPDIKIGLENPDDAAVITIKNNEVTATCDFFAAPFDDPFLVGRIAALNAASDCFVMGAAPSAALTIVQLPLGHQRAQTQIMRELMAGSVQEFNAMQAAVVGGHTIEGPRTMIGFTVLGNQVAAPTTKGQLKAGDRLVLTKPIGTGILLAAWMQAQMPGTFYQPLIDSMLKSNHIALELIERFPISGLTDVTGFGFFGHLSEMLRASGASAAIRNNAIPRLPGSQAMLEAGIESTLAPENRSQAEAIDLKTPHALDSTALSALFDPQTGGGLLFGIDGKNVDDCLSFLHDSGFSDACEIGEITKNSDPPKLSIE